jgi:predicted secreted hydrolase
MMNAHMTRRAGLLQALAVLGMPAWASSPQGISRRPLRFPRDFGAHPDTGLEWWYLTGLLGTDDASAPLFGYQLTFFRLRNRDAAVQAHPSALAPRQLLLAHVALSDLRAGRLRHDQRLGRALAGAVQASEADCDVRLRDWFLKRTGDDRYQAGFGSSAAGFALQLELHSPQPPLLQGDAGYSRKGPEETQASHYYSRPQLLTSARLSLDRKSAAGQRLRGRSWLDHERSDSLLAPGAVGWDWLGLNLLDGGALTAFRLRRADGSSLWTGGSWRRPDGRTQVFGDGELQFRPGKRWRSPASLADYPVEWTLGTPAQTLQIRALFEAQEVDARASSGMQYWEGGSELFDASGRLIGRGYLEMTGYAKRMSLPA